MPILKALLVDFGLEQILHEWGLNGVAIWEDVLSAGEQQRLSFAVHGHAPKNRPRAEWMDAGACS